LLLYSLTRKAVKTSKNDHPFLKPLFLYKPVYEESRYWFNWYKKPLQNLSLLWQDDALTKVQVYDIQIYFSLWNFVNVKFSEVFKTLNEFVSSLDDPFISINKFLLLPRKTLKPRNIWFKKSLKNFFTYLLIKTILNFSFIYNIFFYKPFYFWWSRYVVKLWSKSNIYKFQLKFKFKALKIIPTFGTRFQLYFSASQGVFNARLSRPKKFKKTKAVKFVMAKYLRKLLIVSNITWMVLVIRNNPLFLNEILQLLNEPSVHKYLNPFSKKIINEFSKRSLRKPYLFKFSYFHYIFSKFYGINRHPRPRGKVKRKIYRKLFRLVNKVD